MNINHRVSLRTSSLIRVKYVIHYNLDAPLTLTWPDFWIESRGLVKHDIFGLLWMQETSTIVYHLDTLEGNNKYISHCRLKAPQISCLQGFFKTKISKKYNEFIIIVQSGDKIWWILNNSEELINPGGGWGADSDDNDKILLHRNSSENYNM